MDYALAFADSFDGLVRIRQSKPVGCDKVQGEPVRVQLLQRQFAGLKVMSARGFDGDVFIGDFRKRKIRADK